MSEIAALQDFSALDSVDLPRHRWYFFKEGFSPAIVNAAIDDSECDSEDLIVDPFSGSGTTPLCAAMRGHRFFGIEVNPFLQFVAQVKLDHSKSSIFEKYLDAARMGVERGRKSDLEKFSTFSELAPAAKKRNKWLFNSAVLRAFAGAQHAIANGRSPARRLVHLCLLGAALDSANAKKDGKCLRYKKNWKELNLGKNDFLSHFENRASIIHQDIVQSSDIPGYGRIVLGDARRLQMRKQFRLCVTSPPYLNSFDYTDVYRPELFLGGFVGSMSELRAIRQRTIRSHVQTSWEDPKTDSFGQNYAKAISLLRNYEGKLWDRRIIKMIQAYFEDMGAVLSSLRRAADKRGSVWMVVSTSAYMGFEIPVDLIIADIAATKGWYLREINVLRHLRRVSGQQWKSLSSRRDHKGPFLRESVIVLDAQPRTRQI